VGHRRTVLIGAIIALLVLSFSAAAAESEITHNYEANEEYAGYRTIEVTTPFASYVFSEDGGALRSLFLTFAPYGASQMELVAGTITQVDTLTRQYVKNVGYPFSLSADGLEDGEYELQEPVKDEDGTLHVTFVGSIGGAAVTKTYTFYTDRIYIVGVTISIDPGTSGITELSLVMADYTPSDEDPERYYLYDGQRSQSLLDAGSIGSFDGVGLMDKAVVFFLQPTAGTSVLPYIRTSDTVSYGVTLSLNESTAFDFSVYGGRRRFILMEDAGLAELDQQGVVSQLMTWVIRFLNWLYRVTGNYGWAIILFTVLLRVVMYPLMRKQYHSMAKMQRMQPKMKQIQERFKDEKQLQQQKIMELYKKEGVNPMSGCLPMLIQLPIIIIIWRGLLYTSELIHISPSFLWIPDLSLADPTFVLVILTTAIMLVQQWLMSPSTSRDGAKGQKYIGFLMPIMLAFFLWRFPAGLWLYYLLTTATQVGQQMIINREMANADRKHAMAGVGTLDASDVGESDGGTEE